MAFFLRKSEIEGTRSEKLRHKLSGTEKEAEHAKKMYDNIIQVLDKNKHQRNAIELFERNAILSACISRENSDELFLLLGVSSGSQIKKHKNNRTNYLDPNHESSRLTDPSLYFQPAFYPPKVLKIIQDHFASDEISYPDILGRKIIRKGDNGRKIVRMRRWMNPANVKENYKLFVEYSGKQILDIVGKIPCSKTLESLRPCNCFYFKCSQFGACPYCLLSLKNYFLWQDFIRHDYFFKLPTRASTFVAQSICETPDCFISCIENKCKSCKIEEMFTFSYYKEKYNVDTLSPDEEISIFKYEQTKNSHKSTRSHTELIKSKIKLSLFFPQLQKFMAKYKKHYFRLKLQNTEVSKLISPDEHLPPNTLIIFADYSENVGQKSATTDGTQNQYRSRLNFSLCNLVFFYSYFDNNEQTHKKVRFDIHVISSDIDKGNLLFVKSLKLVLAKLFDENDPFFSPSQKITNIILCSDTSRGEFKSSACLSRLHRLSKELNLVFLFITFETKHGKSLYDLAGSLWEMIYSSECIKSLEKLNLVLADLDNIACWMNHHFRESRTSTSRIEKRFTLVVDPIPRDEHYDSPYESNFFFDCLKN